MNDTERQIVEWLRGKHMQAIEARNENTAKDAVIQTAFNAMAATLRTTADAIESGQHRSNRDDRS